MNWRIAKSLGSGAALLFGSALFPASMAAQDFYLSVAPGYGLQASDSEPYGDNIAIDADFPSAFGGGDGVAGSVAIGYVLSDMARLEGRVGLHRANFAETHFGTGERNGEEYVLDGSIESTTFTLEAFYDLPMGAITPYLKVGVGVSSNSYAARLGGAGVAAFDPFDGTPDGFYDAYPDESTTNFAWNVGIGGSTALSPRFDLFGEYQFMAFGDVQTGQDDFTDGFRIEGASAHEGLVGIRIRLGS